MPRSSPTSLLLDGVTRAAALAHAQRRPPLDMDRAAVIAVASLDDRILTTPVTALVAQLLDAVSPAGVVAVEADGLRQPLRGPLGAGSGGDLHGLGTNSVTDLARAQIETCADPAGTVPFVGVAPDETWEVDGATLEVVVRRAQHRWPTVVVDLPYTCPAQTIAAGTHLATHVLLVTDGHHQGHDWLYREGHHLTQAAREGRVTVVMLDGPGDTGRADTVSLPAADPQYTARERMRVPLDTWALTTYHRLLSRLYPPATAHG
ncbi:MAG: hypothetical protein Q4G50_07315 [Corynebacterium sp.]|uniref:hypothetical protein n=1 Tax=Corynebacterium sp. TaxID=1720 RepID=UPI0026DFC9B7|nr:hypothetical protein [Corynebacterium sp.]MDO5669796.1 hypothetical protein [Corynebacterium sp.]